MDILKQLDADVAVIYPYIAQQIATDPVKLDFISRKLNALGFAGGNISQTTGDTLARQVDLFNIYGSTENGLSLTLRPLGASAVNTWYCMEFHPNAGYVFRPVGDGRYEAVVIRNPPEYEQPVFENFPQLKEWSTKDLFTPHATKPGVWVYHSRIDDNLVFADATMFNPLEYEELVSGHSDVRSALMLGSQRRQACLLIELNRAQDLAKEAGGVSTALDTLWPLISHANERCTRQSAVLKSHVLFTRPEKPLPKGFKGTVRRAAAAQLYADEMEALYSSV